MPRPFLEKQSEVTWKPGPTMSQLGIKKTTEKAGGRFGYGGRGMMGEKLESGQ